MIERYSRPEMTNLWSEEAKFASWLEVEILACEAWAEQGKIPRAAVEKIRRRARINVGRIKEIENVVRHDVIAFTTQVAETVGPEARFVHYGLTSSDVVDTALALRMKRAMEMLIEEVHTTVQVLNKLAEAHAFTLMMGRTHGMHAEPTTFGLKCLLWSQEFQRQVARMQQAHASIAVGKISGAVGTFAHTGTVIEEYVCGKLGLKPAPVSSQVLQRDRHAEYMAALANTAATIEKVAMEIRHLQRSEVGEVEEPFGSGQKGSSAMPHKRNPVSCEQLCGLARVVRGMVIPALENVALWHERDITHSSVERIIVPDACIALDYMLAGIQRVVGGLTVKPERMRKNLDLYRGVIYSGRVLLELVETGMTREDAYAVVQGAAMRTLAGGADFATEFTGGSPEAAKRLASGRLASLLDPMSFLDHVEAIYARCGVRCPARPGTVSATPTGVGPARGSQAAQSGGKLTKNRAHVRKGLKSRQSSR